MACVSKRSGRLRLSTPCNRFLLPVGHFGRGGKDSCLMVYGCLLAPHEATNIVTLERESPVTTDRRRTRKNSAARASHKEKVGVGDSTSTKQLPPPKVFPAMRPALFAQALRARGSAGRAHDETPLRDFRGVLFFRRAKMHGDNPARGIGRVRQRGSRCYPANRARSSTGPKEPRASVDSAWRCGAPAAVSISLRAASSRSGPEKGLPGLLSENHRPHVVVSRWSSASQLSAGACPGAAPWR